MVDKINKILEFINNNRFLSLIIFLMLFIILSVMFTRAPENENGITDPVIEEMDKEYKVLAETKDLTFYIEYGKYYVIVNNINMTDEQAIRNTLGITNDIEFEIIIPGALLRDKGNNMFNYQE